MRTVLTGASILVCSVALKAPPAMAQQGSSASITVSVPAGALERALLALGRQANLRFVYSSALTAGKTTSGVSGPFTSQAAVGQLLAGTGLSYTFTGGNSVRIFDPSTASNDATATVDGAIALDTIDVSGGGAANGGFTPDTPYETAGSVSHISREQMDRVPPTSTGDVFINTPGVINAGNRVGTSINPNIRGLQGMGRVKVTVDGAEQTASSYRGYIGSRDETYIDPDMIGGVDVTKGPSSGPDSAIGGSVAFRTLSPEDIVKPGDAWGVRVRGGVGSNTSGRPAVDTNIGADRPGIFEGDSWSGSLAAAATTEHFDFVGAYSRRKLGNYFAGTKVPKGVVFPPGIDDVPANALVLPGTEVFNTSEDTQSVLLKGKAKWGDGQSLELGYRLYDSTHGEIFELLFGPILGNVELAPTTTRVDTYTAKYRWDPSDNDLINFRTNIWHSNLFADRNSDGYVTPDIKGDNRLKSWGADLGNSAIFDTSLGKFTADVGANFAREHAETIQARDSRGWLGTNGPSGVRDTFGGYTSLKLDFTDWLSVSGGLRYDYFSSKGEGIHAEFPDRSGSRVSPNVSVTLTPVEGIQIFGQYKEGYRAPSLRETHWYVGSLLGNNPNVKGEVAQNYELGFNVLRSDVLKPGDSLRFKGAYFWNHYDDYLIRAPVPNDGQIYGSQYWWTNIDRANFEGFELSGTYDAGAWFVEGSLTKYRNIEYCLSGICSTPGTSGKGPITNDYNSNYIPPEYSGSLTAGVRLLDQKLTLGGRVHFAGSRVGSSWKSAIGLPGQIGTSHTWPGYEVFDIFGSYKVSDSSALNFSVENVTDKYYFGALVSGQIPSPGRTARMSFTTKLGESDFGSGFWDNSGSWTLGTEPNTWSGFYFGAHGMRSEVRSDVTMSSLEAFDDPLGEDTKFKLKGSSVGIHAGYDHRFSNGLVLGLTGDFSALGHNRETRYEATEGARLNAGELESSLKSEFDWLATLRGRVGYTFNDKLMVYGTAGVAFMDADYERTQYMLPGVNDRETVPSFTESFSSRRIGYTVGAGGEYALGGGWSLTGEVLFTRFGKKSVEFSDARAGIMPDTTETVVIDPGVPPSLDFTLPGCNWPTNPVSCINPGTPAVTEERDVPGSHSRSVGRQLLDAISIPTVKLGLTYRF